MTHRTIAAWALALALSPALTGCGLFGSDDAATTTAPPKTGSTSTTFPLAIGPEVLDPGQAPQRELRLHLVEGAVSTVALTVDLDVSQRAGSANQSLNSPPVTERVRFTVGAVDPTGAGVTFVFTDVTVDRTGSGLTDAEYLTLTADLQALVGLGGTAHLSDRGALTEVHYREPAGLDPSVTATLKQFEGQLGALTPTLPTEPVGVGARWRAETKITASGLTVSQVTTYELTSFTADAGTYTTTVEQTAAPQAVQLSGLPAGTTARLVSASTTGTGSGRLATSSPVATGRTKQTGTQVIELSDAKGAPTRLEQQLTMALTIEAVG